MRAESSRVSFGVETHSGWAILVALAGSRLEPEVVLRERLTLADPARPGAKQPFHAAESMPFQEAQSFIQAARADAGQRARGEMKRVVEALSDRGLTPKRCAVLTASSRELPDLKAVLSSHALIHTAEGDHFRDAIAEAAEASGLAVTRIRRKDLSEQASRALARPAGELEQTVALWKKSQGPPWGRDQKLAALAAWCVL